MDGEDAFRVCLQNLPRASQAAPPLLGHNLNAAGAPLAGKPEKKESYSDSERLTYLHIIGFAPS